MKKFEIGMAMQEKMIELFNDGYVFKPKSWSGDEILFIKDNKQYALGYTLNQNFDINIKYHLSSIYEVKLILTGFNHIGDHFGDEVVKTYEKGYLIAKTQGYSNKTFSPYIYTLEEIKDIARLREKRFKQKFRINDEIACPVREVNERTLEILWNAVKKQGGKIRKKDIQQYRYFPLKNGENSKETREYMTKISIYTNGSRSCTLYI